jgi:hypothetical protein
MKKIIKILNLAAILLLLAGVVSSCEKDNKNNEDFIQTFLVKLQSVPSSYENNDFPEWLSIKIAEFEMEPASVLKVKIFYGEWNKQYVYFIRNNLYSCVLCNVYYEDGKEVILNENNRENFCNTSKNWKLVYEFGEALGF